LIRRASAFQPGIRVLERELVALGLEMLVLLVLVEQQVPQELEEQELMEVSPRKEPEEELREQVPLLIPHQKKEVQVIPPQLARGRVFQELGEG
jgi:hypothetical protein